MNFGDAPIKREGMIADPDEFEFACVCKKCAAKYIEWKKAFTAQQEALNKAEENEK